MQQEVTWNVLPENTGFFCWESLDQFVEMLCNFTKMYACLQTQLIEGVQTMPLWHEIIVEPEAFENQQIEEFPPSPNSFI